MAEQEQITIIPAFQSQQPSVNDEEITIIPNVTSQQPTSDAEEITFIKAPTKAEEFAYGFEVSRSDIGYGIDYLRAQTPFGSFKNGPEGFKYYTANEIYGDDFEGLEKDQRRERILQVDQQEAEQNHSAVAAYGRQDSASAMAGGFVGSLSSPTTLVPVGLGAKVGYKAIALGSAILGSEYNVLQQLATKGEVDAVEVAKVAGISAVGGVALLGGGRGLVKGYGKIKKLVSKQKSATPDEILAARDKVNEIDEVTLEAVEKGVKKEDMPAFYRERLDMTTDEIAEAIALSPEKPAVFSAVEAFNARMVNELGAGEDIATKYVGIKNLLLPQSDAIRDISPVLSRLIRDFHRLVGEGRKDLKPIENLMEVFKKMPAHIKEEINDLMFDSNAINKAKVRKLFADANIKAGDDLDAFYTTMQRQKGRLEKGSKGKIKLPDDPYYVTREVKDYVGLRKHLGSNVKSVLTKALEQRAKTLEVSVSNLLDEERDFITNAVLKGLNPVTTKGGKLVASSFNPDAKPSFLKGRKIGFINRELQQFYYNPFESAARYLEKSERMIRKKELFGEFAHFKGNQFDAGESVGAMVGKLEATNAISKTDLDLIKAVLEAQFSTGNKQLSKVASAYKQLTYASFLANYATSIIQLADSGFTAWVHGFRNTLGSVLKGGEGKLTVKDMFMLDATIAESFSSGMKISNSLNVLMKWSGFKMFDRFGKDLLLNTAWRSAQNMVKTPAGIAKLRREVGDAFPNNFDRLVDEIAGGKITKETDLVKSYLYSKVSDQHLTSSFEMPLKYSQMEDGRILYTLRSFTIKQAALMRKRISLEWANGNKKVAMKNLVSFMLLIPTTNMTIQMGKDLMLGREVDLKDEFVERYADNIFRVFATSQYAVSKLAKGGKLSDFVLDTIAPPLSVFDNFFSGLESLIKDAEYDPKIAKDLPFLGKFYYNWFGGGLEDYQEKKQKREDNELFGED